MENFEKKFMQPPNNEEKNIVPSEPEIRKEGTPVVENPEVVNEPISKEVADIKTKEDKYGPEAIREDIKFKAEKIRGWAQQMGLTEGKDFLIIESIVDVEIDTEVTAPHEFKQFFVSIHEDQYRKFKEYILGQYSEERKRESPDNKYGGPKLDYSWGGRFAVGWDGVPFDTVAVSNIENLSAPTHQEEFKKFFKQKAGFDFPTSETLNPMLKEMSEKRLDTYKSALEKLKTLREHNLLPDDGYGLIDGIEHAVMILEDAKGGEAVVNLPEVLRGEMPAKMRHYADLTYNAEDIKNLDKVAEITGISIPEESRIDRIFSRYGFEREKMEDICRDFSDYIMIKRELEKTRQNS